MFTRVLPAALVVVLVGCPEPRTEVVPPTFRDAQLRLRLAAVRNDAGVDVVEHFDTARNDLFATVLIATEADGGQHYVNTPLDRPNLYLPSGLARRLSFLDEEGSTPRLVIDRDLEAEGTVFRFELLGPVAWRLSAVRSLAAARRGVLAPGDLVIGSGTLISETATGHAEENATVVYSVVDASTESPKFIDNTPLFAGGKTLTLGLGSGELRLSEPVATDGGTPTQVGFGSGALTEYPVGLRLDASLPWSYGPLLNFDMWGTNPADGVLRWPLVTRTVKVPAGTAWNGSAFGPLEKTFTPVSPQSVASLDFATSGDAVPPRLFLAGAAQTKVDPDCERGTCLVMETSSASCASQSYAVFTLSPVTDRQNRTFRLRVMGGEPRAYEHLRVTQFQGNAVVAHFFPTLQDLPAGTVAGYPFDLGWQEFGFDDGLPGNTVAMTVRIAVAGCLPGTKVLLQGTGIYNVP